ncbi:RNA-directed DNA polymerase, eukaryota, reverse transcriptase zinc-binding domain protein [Tanacetum coccineum]
MVVTYVEGNKLNFKPNVISENGDEFVVFDEELVQKGSAKWKLTLCGYFVGCSMFEYELNYNLRRMWSMYGLIDVKASSNGNCFFKFRNEIGINEVLKQGNWIAKLTNVPLESWSEEGVSALASSLGKPLIMDNMTTQMCKYGFGRLEYVEYSWKPEICSHCLVFGYGDKNCVKRPQTTIESELNKEKVKSVDNDKEEIEVTIGKELKNVGKQDMNVNNKRSNFVHNKVWPIHKETLNAMKKTSNKYAVLSEMNEDARNDFNVLKDRIIVDQYLNKKLQPSIQETKDWTKDMISYFKEKLEEDRLKEKNSTDEKI